VSQIRCIIRTNMNGVKSIMESKIAVRVIVVDLYSRDCLSMVTSSNSRLELKAGEMAAQKKLPGVIPVWP